MCGQSPSDNRATVIHNGSVGLSFRSMVEFNIYSLAFTSYNRSLSYGSHPASNSALYMHSSLYAKLVNCSFHNNFGTALTVQFWDSVFKILPPNLYMCIGVHRLVCVDWVRTIKTVLPQILTKGFLNSYQWGSLVCVCTCKPWLALVLQVM